MNTILKCIWLVAISQNSKFKPDLNKCHPLLLQQLSNKQLEGLRLERDMIGYKRTWEHVKCILWEKKHEETTHYFTWERENNIEGEGSPLPVQRQWHFAKLLICHSMLWRHPILQKFDHFREPPPRFLVQSQPPSQPWRHAYLVDQKHVRVWKM